MDIQTLEIVQTANRLVDTFGTRDPHRIAKRLGLRSSPWISNGSVEPIRF